MLHRSRIRASSAADEEQESFEVLHRHAGGIDIGATSHGVSVPPERDASSVRDVWVLDPRLDGNGDVAEAVSD